MNVHTNIHNSAGSFCYDHHAIHDALQELEDNLLNEVINCIEEQDQDPVIKSIKLSLVNSNQRLSALTASQTLAEGEEVFSIVREEI